MWMSPPYMELYPTLAGSEIRAGLMGGGDRRPDGYLLYRGSMLATVRPAAEDDYRGIKTTRFQEGGRQ